MSSTLPPIMPTAAPPAPPLHWGDTWGNCWRFALEVPTANLARLELVLIQGLGLETIARDTDFAMLASADHAVALCLRHSPSAPSSPLSFMLMVKNPDALTARLQTVGIYATTPGTASASEPRRFVLATNLHLDLYLCPS